MKQDIRYELAHHKLAYVCLIIGLAVAVGLFMAVWPHRELQRYVIVGLSVYYFLWGVVTHTKADHITTRIVAEYAAIATLAGLTLWLLTL